MQKTLSDLCVMVTRPKPQGQILCEKIKTLGGVPVYLPTIEIMPPENTTILKEQIAQLDQYDLIIFISPQAVSQSIPLIRKHWPMPPAKLKFLATGQGTANALHTAGFSTVIFPPEEWSTEGLLKLPILQNISQQKIALVRGEGGRELLADTLKARGANVTHFIAYRRTVPSLEKSESYASLLQQQKIDIIVCTSGESLHNLITLVGVANKSFLQDVALVVVSQRLVLLAKELQFTQVFLAGNASHNMIIDSLESYAKHHKRKSS
ncbi:MAG: uroporphyrinogen-III synthase [Gammaproteobacteria bacterium]